ncbi:MAG: hypothetical protein NZ602_00370 [Thermoguttaceae bacterium]|nr:hypothetical protein [Thermoguttaceae bacterium]MDW8037019.1 hypothetical protein [Thermoguttaceae bacterium]
MERASMPTSGGEIYPNQEAEVLLERAILNLETWSSVNAKIHYYFELFNDQTVNGIGNYSALLSESGQLFRWELHLPFQNQTLHWWQLFDGQSLWTYQTLPKDQKEQLTRVDVLQLAEHLKKQGNLPKLGEIGNWPGLGGLPRLLRSLHANFQFTLLEPGSIRVTDGQHSQQLPVWKLLGTWKPERLTMLLPDQAQGIYQSQPIQWEKLPVGIPDQVVVFLGQEDLFPYEIQYRRKLSRRWTRWLTEFAWLRSEDRCLAKLEFVELSLNVPLPAETFHFQPPAHLKPIDATQEFIQQIEKKMQK